VKRERKERDIKLKEFVSILWFCLPSRHIKILFLLPLRFISRPLSVRVRAPVLKGCLRHYFLMCIHAGLLICIVRFLCLPYGSNRNTEATEEDSGRAPMGTSPIAQAAAT
jgi:hypothetical protein